MKKSPMTNEFGNITFFWNWLHCWYSQETPALHKSGLLSITKQTRHTDRHVGCFWWFARSSLFFVWTTSVGNVGGAAAGSSTLVRVVHTVPFACTVFLLGMGVCILQVSSNSTSFMQTTIRQNICYTCEWRTCTEMSNSLWFALFAV